MYQPDYQLFALRRKDLLAQVKQNYPHVKNGTLIFFAAYERGTLRFEQESSFYYLTGLIEPAAVLVMHSDGKTILYLPNCRQERAKWALCDLDLSAASAKKIGVDEIVYLGDEVRGYQLFPYQDRAAYTRLITDLQADGGKTLCTLCPNDVHQYVEQRNLLARLREFGLNLEQIDISPEVARMRRSKDMKEIEYLYKAVDITSLAQEAAARAIQDGATEMEVQASLEYIMTGSGADRAFASIVGSGAYATVLHYNENFGTMHNGDLVVVDIGARYNYYCADITRTYPVSGTFTERQKEIYTMVLDTQAYIAEIAAPGMWLSHPEHPDKSLNHLARAYLQKKGYDKYFPHGIGHFLGIDVHDVGDVREPLKAGDVITIEPGIYIPSERIGVRIEDDYWITKDGAICLSEDLPKDIETIEQMVQAKFE
jgi:Xaa-Pro aminopeptidase